MKYRSGIQNLLKILVIIIVIFFWYLLTNNQTTSLEKLLFPSPSRLILTLISSYFNIIEYSLVTWYRVLIGLIIGSSLGILVGMYMSYSKWFYIIADPIIELIRPIPPVALTPFFILWFGLGNVSQLTLISLGCFMIITVSTYSSIKNIPPVYIKSAKSLGAKDFFLYKTVYWPAILPSLLPAIRVALASSFALTVAAEYLGAQGGIGYMIRNARTILQTDVILLGALILGIQSTISDYLIRLFFNKVTIWLPKFEN